MRSDFTVKGCPFTLTPRDQSFTSRGGPATVAVTTNPGCSWSVADLPPWLALASRGTGIGSGTVSLLATVNGGPARSGSFTIAGRIVTVEQAGPSGP